MADCYTVIFKVHNYQLQEALDLFLITKLAWFLYQKGYENLANTFQYMHIINLESKYDYLWPI